MGWHRQHNKRPGICGVEKYQLLGHVNGHTDMRRARIMAVTQRRGFHTCEPEAQGSNQNPRSCAARVFAARHLISARHPSGHKRGQTAVEPKCLDTVRQGICYTWYTRCTRYR